MNERFWNGYDIRKHPCRAWVNQPSTFQPMHKYHGQNVLTFPPTSTTKDGVEWIMVFFTSGPVFAMEMPVLSLSGGWKEA